MFRLCAVLSCTVSVQVCSINVPQLISLSLYMSHACLCRGKIKMHINVCFIPFVGSGSHATFLCSFRASAVPENLSGALWLCTCSKNIDVKFEHAACLCHAAWKCCLAALLMNRKASTGLRIKPSCWACTDPVASS